MVAAAEGQLRGVVGRIDRRAAEDAGDERRFLQVQVADALAEELLGGGLDPVHAVAEIELVAVHLQDLFLGVTLLDLEGEKGLLELAPERHLPAEEQGRGQLLGDRASALGAAVPLARPEVLPDGPQDPPEVDAAVLEEAGVLGGQDGLLQDIGDLGIGHLDPPVDGEFLDDLPAFGKDRGDDIGLEGLQVRDRGQVLADGEVGPEKDAQEGRGQVEGGQPDAAPAPLLFLGGQMPELDL